jgi:DNA helicase II / ATP-dependent DNA helicase PcrA
VDTAALLEGLTESQAEAVTTDAAPLCILAGAGSGKTRVLTRRIAHRVATGSADPRHVLALTFTRKAAGELNARLTSLGVRDVVAAGTFHGVAYAQLRRRWADTGRPAPTLLDRKGRLIGRLLSTTATDGPVQAVDVAGEIEWAKARMVAPSRYEEAAAKARRRPPLPPAAMASFYERYEVEKRRRGLVDFDDLLVQCAELLATEHVFARTQQWAFRHLFVDEFQDVNPVQHRLLEGWLGPRTDLCVVGDPNQAIYAWNGADPRYLTRFSQRHPSSTVIHLDDSFRSTPQILAVGQAVLANGTRELRPLRPHRTDGPIPTVRSFADEADEARGIVRAMRDRRRPGMPWSHLAVLTRTHAQGAAIEQALTDAGIPYRVRGGGAFLRRPEVQGAIEEMRAAGGLLWPRLKDLDANARAVDDPAEGEADSARRASLEELVRLGRQYAAIDPTATTDAFVSWLAATLGTEGRQRNADAVELATFHAAKGLEWPIVFLAGLEDGFVPIGRAGADSPGASAEERRLLYVAVTRAESELHCSWARKRTFGNRSVPRRPSPWLEDIEAARAALAAGGDGTATDWRERLVEERRRLRSAPALSGHPRGPRVTVGLGADPELLARLRTWRANAARTAGVPATVIFHDTTLAAIAEAQPVDRRALVALPGLGPVKAERYGDALIGVVAEHVGAAAS